MRSLLPANSHIFIQSGTKKRLLSFQSFTHFLKWVCTNVLALDLNISQNKWVTASVIGIWLMVSGNCNASHLNFSPRRAVDCEAHYQLTSNYFQILLTKGQSWLKANQHCSHFSQSSCKSLSMCISLRFYNRSTLGFYDIESDTR